MTISEKPIKFYDWKGAGYIIIDTQTGAGAYMLEGNNGSWTKNICKKKIRRAVTGMLKGGKFTLKGGAATLAFVAVTSFITNLANSVPDLNECHQKLITGVLAAMEGMALVYEALSYVRFSGVGSLLLYASMPIMMYPVIALATQGMKKCSADTNTRANRLSDEIYSVRSVGVRANGGKGCPGNLSVNEYKALKYAGLKDDEITENIRLNGEIHLFRGTTNPPFQSNGGRAPLSASTDPFVATVFASEAKSKNGSGRVYFGGKSQYGTFDSGSHFSVREREVALQMESKDFAEKSSNSLSLEQSQKILKDMGFPDIPTGFSNDDRTGLLNTVPKMTPQQIADFMSRAKAIK